MAVITFQQMSKLVVEYVLAAGPATPPASWTMGLSTIPVSTMARNSVWSATVSGTNINEIGVTANGYARQTIARTVNQAGIDWGTSTFDSTLATGGQSSAADQVTFGAFSGAPTPNGANTWVLTDGSTVNASTSATPFVAGDLAAVRTFANGDTEKVTATVKAG